VGIPGDRALVSNTAKISMSPAPAIDHKWSLANGWYQAVNRES